MKLFGVLRAQLALAFISIWLNARVGRATVTPSSTNGAQTTIIEYYDETTDTSKPTATERQVITRRRPRSTASSSMAPSQSLALPTTSPAFGKSVFDPLADQISTFEWWWFIIFGTAIAILLLCCFVCLRSVCRSTDDYDGDKPLKLRKLTKIRARMKAEMRAKVQKAKASSAANSRQNLNPTTDQKVNVAKNPLTQSYSKFEAPVFDNLDTLPFGKHSGTVRDGNEQSLNEIDRPQTPTSEQSGSRRTSMIFSVETDIDGYRRSMVSGSAFRPRGQSASFSANNGTGLLLSKPEPRLKKPSLSTAQYDPSTARISRFSQMEPLVPMITTDRTTEDTFDSSSVLVKHDVQETRETSSQQNDIASAKPTEAEAESSANVDKADLQKYPPYASTSSAPEPVVIDETNPEQIEQTFDDIFTQLEELTKGL